MNNATPVLLAFVLVLSVPAMTVVAAEPTGEMNDEFDASLQQESSLRTTTTSAIQPPQELENTTNRLQLTGDVRSEYTDYRSDLGMTLASVDDELRIDHDQYATVDSEFEDATTEERKAMIQAAYDRLKNRSAALEQREREAVRAHAAGDLSTEELLQTLVRNQNSAAKLSESLQELESRASGLPGTLSSTRTDYKMFDYHRTALRTNLEQMAANPGRSHYDVVVSTSQNGYSLSMMEGDQYIVETARFDNRDDTAGDRFADGEAYDYSRELYPWGSDKPYFQDNSHDHYWAEMTHEQGRLEFYFDSRSGEVYREVQELIAPSLPSEEIGPWNGDGLNMTMNRTPSNGPVKVTITDQETGEPVQATITVDGDKVGETGDDGTLWVIPLIGSHELTAETENGTVSGITNRSYVD